VKEGGRRIKVNAGEKFKNATLLILKTRKKLQAKKNACSQELEKASNGSSRAYRSYTSL
jgi:hypothetical protein